MAARRRKSTWGGRRPGAGRKGFLKEPHRLTVDFDGAEFERLEAIADQEDVSIAAVIRRAVREHLKRRGRR